MPPVGGALVVGVVVVAAMLVARWADVHALVPSAAVGYALAYGFAASLSQDVLIPLLGGLLHVAGSLSQFDLLNTLSGALFQTAREKSRGATEQQVFHVMLPFLTALATSGTTDLITHAASRPSQRAGR